MLKGRCHCGAVHYEMPEQVMHHAICHCSDCRRHAGAPLVAWAMLKADRVTITGETTVYASSEHGRRHFCGRCGTGLFYVNEHTLPGLIDVQTATLDTPEALPPQIQIQTAERIPWMEEAHRLRGFKRFPPG